MGNGYNYIREIMAINTDRTEPGVVSEFKFVGEIAKMPGWEFNRGKRGVRIVNYNLIQGWQEHTAWLGDVVMHNGKLYSWTDVGWMEFTPGPCTKYDGPNPYEKGTKPHYTYLGETVGDSYLMTHSPTVTLKVVDKRWRFGKVTATQGDVIMHHGQLYTWHKALKYGAWCAFRPDENTDYDGPRPEKPAISYDIKLKEEIMAKKNVFEEKELCLTYIGTTTTVIRENSTAARLYVEGAWVYSKSGYMVMCDGRLYVCAPDGKWHDLTATNVKPGTDLDQLKSPGVYKYSKIPYGHLMIKKVHYSGDKTIVMWEDGTKTIVTRGENEVFDPEKGLVMAIAKKAYGNHGNYYNRIKKWLPEIVEPIWTDEGLVPTPKDDIIELLADMTHRGATKAELVKAVAYSQRVIDAESDSSIDLAKEAENFDIPLLRAKYQK